ncbi:MAG: tetratricopeptide repeat protein [Verrucomicrobiae bacterium]|nr:tetratricopeptide repeat protein [Verrucomicrobiae bacterium]
MPGAWLAAAIFAVHPVHVESVAWITERKNVLSGFFYLAALRVYMEATGLGEGKHREFVSAQVEYVAVLMLYAAALLSKTVTCTLPAVLLLIEWWKRRRLEWRRDLYPLVPMFLITAALVFLNVWFEHSHVGAGGAEWNLTLAQRVLIAGRAVFFYLGKIFWPAELIFIYPRWTPDPGDWLQWLAPFGVAVVLLALWLQRERWGRAPFTALAFFVITLSPALGFVNFYPMIFSFVADHFQYLASIGPIALVSAGFAVSMRTPIVARASAAAALFILGLLTWRQIPEYQDEVSLWEAVVQKNPHALIAQNNLGALVLGSGRTKEAFGHFQAALSENPEDAMVHYNLGRTFRRMEKAKSAAREYEESLKYGPNSAETHAEYASFLASRGDRPSAARHYARAIALKPLDSGLYVSYGIVLYDEGKYREAATQFARALAVNPNDSAARYNFGVLLAGFGRPKDAEIHFRKAIALNPNFAAAHAGLGDILSRQGKREEAAAEYRAALRLIPNFAPAKEGLARTGQIAPSKGK